jgi:hypothetical protein
VGTLPTILIAGGSSLYVQLLDPFPPTVCTIIYAETVNEALDEAVNAHIIVVDSGLKGGAVDLCRRLRGDATTSHIPLALRVANESDAMQALTDVRVKASDFNGLVKAVRRLCPDLSAAPSAAPPLAEGSVEPSPFDDEVKTVIYRRPEGETSSEWPPEPPLLRPDEDLVEFTQDYAGYMNSLIEALESPAHLSAPEINRLGEMSNLLVQQADTTMGTMQSGINEALMAKDLGRMRVLSAAKNSLYEKLQRIRGLIGKLEARPGEPSSVKPGNAPQQKKSELTRAAEAKHAADLAAHKAAQKERRKEAKGRPQVMVPGSAGRTSAVPSWVWLTGAVVVIAIAVFIIVRQLRTTESKKTASTNSPPTMVAVLLTQSEAGIFAQPKAQDKENDRISFAVRWLVNAQPVEGERTLRLPPSSYQSGDRVQVEVTPSDSTNLGQLMRSEEFLAKTIVPGARPAPRPAPDAGQQVPSPPPAPAPSPALAPTAPAPAPAPAPTP